MKPITAPSMGSSHSWMVTAKMKSTVTLLMEVEQDAKGKISTVPIFYVKGDPVRNDAIVSFLRQTADEIEQGKVTLNKRN